MPVQINELMVNATAGSQADTYLFVKTARAGKLEGESTAAGFEGDIVVHGWNWGAQAPTAVGTSQATGRRSYKNLTVTKRVDGATTKLLAALVTNDQVKEARREDIALPAGGLATDRKVADWATAAKLARERTLQFLQQHVG